MTGILISHRKMEAHGEIPVTSEAEIDMYLQVKECQSWLANNQKLRRHFSFFESTCYSVFLFLSWLFFLAPLYFPHSYASLIPTGCLRAGIFPLLFLLQMMISSGNLWPLLLSRAGGCGCTGGSLHKDSWSKGQIGQQTYVAWLCILAQAHTPIGASFKIFSWKCWPAWFLSQN